jgi:hypothetical protein
MPADFLQPICIYVTKLGKKLFFRRDKNNLLMKD